MTPHSSQAPSSLSASADRMQPCLEVRGLNIRTQSGKTLVQDVNFHVDYGEWVSIIGGSGSGKTLTARSIANLLAPGLVADAKVVRLGGHVMREGTRELGSKELRGIRGSEVAYVFQNYDQTFTPYRRLDSQIKETLRVHGKAETGQEINQACARVGIDPAMLHRYPSELSGGQLQRVAIALVVLLKPALIIADEPTTALDAVTQRKVLDLLQEVQRDLGSALLCITHDLRCVRDYAQRIIVMQNGVVVEQGNASDLISNPTHEVTKQLFAASLVLKPLGGVSTPPLNPRGQGLHGGAGAAADAQEQQKGQV